MREVKEVREELGKLGEEFLHLASGSFEVHSRNTGLILAQKEKEVPFSVLGRRSFGKVFDIPFGFLDKYTSLDEQSRLLKEVVRQGPPVTLLIRSQMIDRVTEDIGQVELTSMEFFNNGISLLKDALGKKEESIKVVDYKVNGSVMFKLADSDVVRVIESKGTPDRSHAGFYLDYIPKKAVKLANFIWRLVCTNGLIREETREESLIPLRNETRDTFYGKMVTAGKRVFSREELFIESFIKSSEQRVDNIERTLFRLLKEKRLSSIYFKPLWEEAQKVLPLDGSCTLYDLTNFLTAYGRDLRLSGKDSEALKFERLGGYAIETGAGSSRCGVCKQVL